MELEHPLSAPIYCLKFNCYGKKQFDWSDCKFGSDEIFDHIENLTTIATQLISYHNKKVL
jgi:hypothetical protein